MVKLPAASGFSLWLSTTIEPFAVANCAPSQRSAGQVVVTAVEIASRLNQYGAQVSAGGIVPLAWIVIVFPTTASAEGRRLRPKPSASAGAAGALSAIAAPAASAAVIRVGRFTVSSLLVQTWAQRRGRRLTGSYRDSQYASASASMTASRV